MLALLCFIVCCFADQASVYFTNGQYKIQFGVLDTTSVAWGNFDDTLNQTGWGVLNLRTSGSSTNITYDDKTQMYGAGFLEGALTVARIYQAYQNMYIPWQAGTTSPPSNVVNWFNANQAWVNAQIAANPNDPFWRHIDLLYTQLNGLTDGYNQFAASVGAPKLSLLDIELLSANPDALSVEASMSPELRLNWFEMSKKELRKNKAKFGFERCSVMVKLLDDYSDIYMGHSTWMIYSFMNRIYKIYYFDLHDDALMAKGHSFSSYPGVLCSQDDFYMATSGMGMVQTTNGMYNNSQYDLITNQTLLTWLRIRTAQALASDGKSWSQIVGRYFSGTYTNQYIVVDFNKFKPYQPLSDGVLYIVEEIPSTYEYTDATQYLGRGFWPSYNVPFFPSIYNLSEYPQIVEQYGTDESYDLAPRAKIFRRDATKVTDFDSFKYLMRYNDWKNDPFSEGDPANAIMARADLSPSDPEAFGGYDTKVTNYNLFWNLTSNALGGPTAQGQPPFSWTSEFTDVHVGQPTTFNFDWVVMKPQLF